VTFPKRAALVPVAALVAVAVLACTGCNKPKPSILIISIDSLRADEVARIENGRPVAPALSAFEKESVRFPSALSAAPWTTPSMMAVMTGLPAPAHGVEEHDRALAPSVPVLAERLQKARWRTGAVSPALTLRPEYGFARGFDDYDFEPLGHDVVTSPKLTGKTLHLFDTFSGMPEVNSQVDYHRKDDFADTSVEAVERVLQGLGEYRLHPGRFPESAAGLSSTAFCFAHIDVDIYQSVIDACRFFWPRLTSGGAILFDDYGHVSCRGAKKAVDEKIVADAELADGGLIFGTGFAPFRGGPMHYLAERRKS